MGWVFGSTFCSIFANDFSICLKYIVIAVMESNPNPSHVSVVLLFSSSSKLTVNLVLYVMPLASFYTHHVHLIGV